MAEYRKPTERISRYLCLTEVELKIDRNEQKIVESILKQANTTTQYLVDTFFERGEGRLSLGQHDKCFFMFEVFDLQGEISPEIFQRVKNVALRNFKTTYFAGYFHFIGYLDT